MPGPTKLNVEETVERLGPPEDVHANSCCDEAENDNSVCDNCICESFP